MFHQKGDIQGAIQQFKSAIESKPDYAEAHFNLGYIYKSGQKIHDAIQHFEQAEVFNPELRAFVHKALFELQKDHPENKEVRQKISAISQNNLRNKAIQLIKERAEHVTRYQNGVATFEDNHLISIVDNFEKSFSGKIDWDNALEHLPEKDRGNYSEQLRILLLHVKAHDNDRFQALEARIQTLKETDYPSLHQSYFNFSQGFSSCLKWKDELIFKTAYDLAILNMLIWEIKPRSIIEIGSGNGASAIYMQDLVKMFGLECDIVSFDINNKNNTEASVRYLYADCMDISTFEEYAQTFENLPHPWLFIEDAHVNVDEVLKYFTGFSRPGDYFYIEDTALKQPEIEKWIKTNGKNFLLDTKYLDFFGPNNCCAANGIFKLFPSNNS